VRALTVALRMLPVFGFTNPFTGTGIQIIQRLKIIEIMWFTMQKKSKMHDAKGYSLIDMVIGLGILTAVVVFGLKLVRDWQNNYRDLSLTAKVTQEADQMLAVLKHINTRKPTGSFADLPTSYETQGTFYVNTTTEPYPVLLETKCRKAPSFYQQQKLDAYLERLKNRTKDRLGKCLIKKECPVGEVPFIEISVSDPNAAKMGQVLPRPPRAKQSVGMISAVGCLRHYPDKMVHIIMEGLLLIPKQKRATSIRIWSRELYLPSDSLYSFQRY